MNIYEEKLLDIINEKFQDELNQNTVIIEVNTPEYAQQQGHRYSGWEVAIRKTRKGLRDVRIVISGLDPDIMREADDFQDILSSIVAQARQILLNPPFKQYITQGLIQVTSNNVEFIPKDNLRKNV
ncbi:MAG: hypothetical protein SWH54_16480 [Thermodesulfobacteriota bacterium]|nr:hypothetical protein [Thermodesulfobacteriota bacterium]